MRSSTSMASRTCTFFPHCWGCMWPVLAAGCSLACLWWRPWRDASVRSRPLGASADEPVHPGWPATEARFRSPTDLRAAAKVASAALLRYHERAVTLVFSLVGTDLDLISCTVPEKADVFSFFRLSSYLLKFAHMRQNPLVGKH